jgi:hypothetical protein
MINEAKALRLITLLERCTKRAQKLFAIWKYDRDSEKKLTRYVISLRRCDNLKGKIVKLR